MFRLLLSFLVVFAITLRLGTAVQSAGVHAPRDNKAKLFKQPVDLALDAHGNVWVIDGSLAQVIELSAKGKVLTRWGKKGTKPGQLRMPDGIAIASDGSVWVSTQTATPSVEKFSAAGKALAFRDSAGNVSGLGGRITIDPRGDLWIALGGGVADIPDVIELSPSGKELAHWQAPHKKTSTREGIAVDARRGIVYLSSEFTNAIYKFTVKGKFLGYVAKHGSRRGQVDTPEGLSLDTHGDLFVAEQGNSRVQEFSPTGKVLRTLGTFFTTHQPQAVAVNRSAIIYMLDRGGIRVYNSKGKQMGYWK